MRSPLLDLARRASAAGFAGITITPAMYFAAQAAGISDRDMLRGLDDVGIRVTLLDPLMRGLPGVPLPEEVPERFRDTFVAAEDDCYRVTDALEIDTLNVAHYLGRPTAEALLVEAFGGMCERAGARGLTVLLEFMPSSAGIPDLSTALRIVRAVDAPNAAVMLDTWHFFRSGSEPSALAECRAGEIRGLQVSDAPADAAGSGAGGPRRDRELPGRGAMPLREILAAAFAIDPCPFVGIEVFNADLSKAPPSEAADLAYTTLRDVVASVGRGGSDPAPPTTRPLRR
jgi:sugar phosphate isomerase/epimerase